MASSKASGAFVVIMTRRPSLDPGPSIAFKSPLRVTFVRFGGVLRFTDWDLSLPCALFDAFHGSSSSCRVSS
jgi:hypothetical protein